MSKKKIIIAIDGYSSSGKSTLAKSLARRVGYTYIDSGAMYRAVTLYAIRNGFINSSGNIDRKKLFNALHEIDIHFTVDPDSGQSRTILDGEDVEEEIRFLYVSEHVSHVAALPQVREALVEKQRVYGKNRGIVMDGRDIGTVVFPDAELKLFIEASPEVRAQRRTRELEAKGKSVNYEEVLRNIKERDYLDTHRADSPLQKAIGAIVINNGVLSIEDQDRIVLDYFKKLTEDDDD